MLPPNLWRVIEKGISTANDLYWSGSLVARVKGNQDITRSRKKRSEVVYVHVNIILNSSAILHHYHIKY